MLATPSPENKKIFKFHGIFTKLFYSPAFLSEFLADSPRKKKRKSSGDATEAHSPSGTVMNEKSMPHCYVPAR